jgi:hypothetical protein
VLSGFGCEFVAVLHLTLYGATKRVTAVTKRVTGLKKGKYSAPERPGGFSGGVEMMDLLAREGVLVNYIFQQ